MLVAVGLVAAILIAILGYAGVGFALSAARISAADKTLNSVISHQNQLNAAFHAIDSRFQSLNGSSTFNPTQAKAVIDQFVASSQAAGRTVAQDDASLANASSGLSDQQWLTAFSRGSLERESNRIAHARKALTDARTVAADYVLDGQFLQSFMDALADLETLGNQSATADYAGAKATIATMRAHVDKATQRSTGPGLPPELHSLMIDLGSLVTDFGNLLDAAQANDDAAVATYSQAVQNDGNRISGYNFDQMSSEIDAYYKPLVDGFNSEMAAATA